MSLDRVMTLIVKHYLVITLLLTIRPIWKKYVSIILSKFDNAPYCCTFGPCPKTLSCYRFAALNIQRIWSKFTVHVYWMSTLMFFHRPFGSYDPWYIICQYYLVTALQFWTELNQIFCVSIYSRQFWWNYCPGCKFSTLLRYHSTNYIYI